MVSILINDLVHLVKLTIASRNFDIDLIYWKLDLNEFDYLDILLAG